MISRESVQNRLDKHKKSFGDAFIDPRPLWTTQGITWNDVQDAGKGHSCPVIYEVIRKRIDQDPVEVWRSYQGKNNAYCAISNLLENTGRIDLYTSWTHNELKKKGEKTHPEVKPTFQYPVGYDQHYLLANARMDQYYLSDHFKTLDHIAHGALPGFAVSLEEQQKFAIPVENYQSCAHSASNLDHFTALVAVKTAQVLKSRGIEDQKIVNLLAQNFANTGSVREYGQQKHASRIVSLVIKEIKEAGNLAGVSSGFRRLARPKVERHYFGKRNPRL